MALDAEQRVLRPICDLCREMNVPVEEVATMAELGLACQIDVGAAGRDRSGRMILLMTG